MGIKPLGELLVETGIITPQQLELALKEQSRTGKLLGEILEHLGFATKIQIIKSLALQGGNPYIDLKSAILDVETLGRFPPALLKMAKALPLWLLENSIAIAIQNPSNVMMVDRLRELAKRELFLYTADEKEISTFQDILLGEVAMTPVPETGELLRRKAPESLITPQERTAFRTFHQMMVEALQRKASEVHVEPDGTVVRIRYRIEESMHQGPILARSYHPYLLNWIRQFSRIKPEDPLPQESVVKFISFNREFDLRVSIYPTVQGEKVFLRPQEKGTALLELPQLGFTEEQLKRVTQGVNSPSGVVLVVGPAASGKTTTLYALTLEASSMEKNVTTVEDPVEVQLAHITQINLMEKEGVSLSSILRLLLRQHTDVIMISEIRDKESAQLAMRTAVNGALVMAGFSASDAADALMQLMGMGVDPYFIAYTMNLIIAQRLVRKICEHCREPYEITPSAFVEWEVEEHPVTLYKGRGCDSCGGTGYTGRTAIFEVFEMNDDVRRQLDKSLPHEKLRKLIRDSGTQLLVQNGLQKAFQGIISMEEVIRVLR